MKIEEHESSFEEHRDAIFRWAVEIKGIENSQRIIGLHASRAILDLFSIYLIKKGKIGTGKQLNHRWFKSAKSADKLPDFQNKKQIIEKIVELELLCEKLAYGTKRPVSEIKATLDIFKELEAMLKELENEKE